MSDSLSGLAEGYLSEAQRIKDKLSELALNSNGLNPAEYNRTVAVYEDMLLDCMTTYYKLKNYYKN